MNPLRKCKNGQNFVSNLIKYTPIPYQKMLLNYCNIQFLVNPKMNSTSKSKSNEISYINERAVKEMIQL